MDNYDKIIKELDDEIFLEPNRYENFFKRGQAYYEKGEYKIAIRDFNKALSIYREGHPKLYNSRGLAYLKLNNFEQAIINFNEAIRYKTANWNTEVEEVKEEIESYKENLNMAIAKKEEMKMQ